tara:strand:+ start:1537 stop:1785 length:249 start_codon:yes stop_codon:yes gene_type:complete
MTDKLTQAKSTLSAVLDDTTVPRSIKVKVRKALEVFSSSEKTEALMIDQVLQDLDDITEDPNTPSYTRTQIWNIVSTLESTH